MKTNSLKGALALRTVWSRPRIRSYDARPAPLIFRQKKASPPGVDGNFELAGDAERAGPSLDRGFLSGDVAGNDLLRVGHGKRFRVGGLAGGAFEDGEPTLLS